MKRTIYILLVLVPVFLTACHTQKTGQPIRHKDGRKQVVEQVLQHQPDFQTAKAAKVRFSIRYEERLVTANGTINIYKDSAIIVSVQPMLGIEMLRAELTPQAIVVVDKLNRRYVRTTFEELQKQSHLPISFYDVQALCMNRLFVIGREQQSLNKISFRLTQEDEHYLLQHHEGLLHYTYTIGHDMALQQTELVVPLTDYSARVRYMQHRLVDDVLFPQVVEIILNMPKLTGSCTITLLRSCFGCEVNTTPLNVDKYKQISLKTLLSK